MRPVSTRPPLTFFQRLTRVSRLKFIDGGVFDAAKPGDRVPMRDATLREKLDYLLGISYKGPKWRELR